MRFVILFGVLLFCLVGQTRQYKCEANLNSLMIEVDLDHQVAAFFDGGTISHIPEAGFPQDSWHIFRGLSNSGEMFEITVDELQLTQSAIEITQFHRSQRAVMSCGRVHSSEFDIL